MFASSSNNVDTLFKPATPLTKGLINEMQWQFAPLSDILQGSVATQLRCGSVLIFWGHPV